MFKKISKITKNKTSGIKKYSYNLNKVASIDPFNFNEVFVLEDNIIREKKLKEKLSKDTLISTYIPLRFIINYEINIPKNLIEKIDVRDHIETKAYEELELDEAEKYIIKYKLINSIADEKNMIAEVIIVQEDAIDKYFSSIKNEYDYIDYLGHSGFLFESLYKTKILESKRDIFIYFTEKYTLITLYADGGFLQNIFLNQGLHSLYEKLAQDSEVEIKDFSYEIFVELLTKKGLELDYYDDSEEILFNELSKIFSNLFTTIVNQFNSLQRKFALATIDRVFISTEKGTIPGVIDFTTNYLGEIESNDLKFDTKYNPNNVEIDQLSFLNILSTQYAYKEDYQLYNFTLKKRPPTFFYRKSGQFISITIASLIISLIYPAYQYIYSNITDYKNSKLEVKLNKLNMNFNSLNTNFNNLLKSYKKEQNIEKNKRTYIKNVEKLISILHKDKEGYTPISSLIIKVSLYMKNNKIYAKEIDLDEGILKLEVFADKESYITNFANELVNKENLTIETNGVMKDKNSKNYTSIINVKVDL
jgi:hypothetical protein